MAGAIREMLGGDGRHDRLASERLDWMEAQPIFGVFRGLGEMVFSADITHLSEQRQSIRVMLDEKIARASRSGQGETA